MAKIINNKPFKNKKMTKALAKIFTVTRDEYDLIEDFLEYHGNIFGFENIHVIDNNSQDRIVLETYNKYKQKGVNVHFDSDYTNNGQGKAFTKFMSMFKNDAEYLIGLDTDEFIFLDCEDVLMQCNVDAIRSALTSLPQEASIFHISSYPFSVVDPSNTFYNNQKMLRPARNMNTFTDGHISGLTKVFYRASRFSYTGNGNHGGSVTFGNTIKSSIGYFHFHATGSRRNFERAKMIVDGYKYVDTTSTIDAQILVFQQQFFCYGHHRVQQYLTFLMRKFVLDCFVKYVKRLPEETELTMHVSRAKLWPCLKIITDFANCVESIQKKEQTDLVFDSNQYDTLLFFDHPPKEAQKRTALQIAFEIIENKTR